ncbi:small ribosomal subunit protein uS5m-like [Saccoglossus kowalevskii]|uniref:Small ribosomal subunit protein uS5m n=1 Tax=Saccoglossus kowalevskii TaxID=10224 RepID=A0ABM0GJV5_SACKO|nr:PREDICTED: 28S ribosomal protein S5, mitochondrial-like [Saccoglossus kowalevskii]
MAAHVRLLARVPTTLSKDIGIVARLSQLHLTHRYVSEPSSTVYGVVTPMFVQCRHSSFFNTLTGDQLWKSVMADSGKASKKGRGKRGKKGARKNLNRGQYLGDGKISMEWPGLNAPVVKDNAPATIRRKAADPNKEAELLRLRESWDKKKKRSSGLHERGWTSVSWGGRSVGPPDPVPGCDFEDFDSRVIQVKRVFNMTATVGRKRSTFAVAVVGNANGAFGYAVGKSEDIMSALRKAKNSAAHCLYYCERYENHTLYHDVETRFKATRIRMKKQNKGYGLRCHRIIKEICKLAGITDLYARVYGSKNPLNICHAVFQGLASQETHQQIADRHRLHLVEFREECDNFPCVVASPQGGDVRDDIEIRDWDKEMPLEWKEIKPKSKRSAGFERDGTMII